MITNTTAKSVYTIASGVTSYPIGFDFQYNPDGTPQINVYIKPHPETPLIYGTNYTISADGLSVELISGYEVGDKLVILRAIPMVQLSDYVIGRIDPEQIEHDFDEAVMRDQQLEAEIDLLEALPIDHELRIQAIEDVIPSDASSTNKLTDKNYVDTELSSKANSADLSTVATSGSYNDLTDTPTLGTMAAEDASDYTPTASLSAVATSGSYNDLTDTPTLGTAAAADTTDFATSTQGGLADTAVQPADLATVATTGDYNDLLNKPSVPSAQVNSDWNANSGVAEILNKPTLGTMAAESANDYTPSASLATVATSGSYTDLSNTPTLGTAAAAATTDFATSAQGAKADTAIQPGDLATVATSGSYSDLNNTPSIPSSIDDLSDVNVSSVQDGEFLRYDSVAGEWKNAASTASVGFSGITGSPYDNVALGKELSIKSNCISEIPAERIQLELLSGVMYSTTITLKAGSKVYVPNGADVFDELTIASDISTTCTSDSQGMLFASKLGDTLYYAPISQISSGVSGTLGSGNIWYSPVDDKVYRSTDGTSWDVEISLPLAIVSCDNNQNITIDQKFETMGYIDTRIFVLPGIKVLIPDGRDANGVLKNTELTINSVLTKWPYTGNSVLGISTELEPLGDLFIESHYLGAFNTPPKFISYYSYYNVAENKFYKASSNEWEQKPRSVLGFCTGDGTTITSLRPYTAYQAIDYSDTNFIARQSMPCEQHKTLTLYASGTDYTAPTSGYFCLYVSGASGVSAYASLQNSSTYVHILGDEHYFYDANGAARLYCPVKKGDKARVNYNGSFTTVYLEFVYAAGEAEI